MADQLGQCRAYLIAHNGAETTSLTNLARKAGFAVEKAGNLDAARLIEPVGMLNIRLGYGLGQGTSIAPAWIKLAA